MRAANWCVAATRRGETGTAAATIDMPRRAVCAIERASARATAVRARLATVNAPLVATQTPPLGSSSSMASCVRSRVQRSSPSRSLWTLPGPCVKSLYVGPRFSNAIMARPTAPPTPRTQATQQHEQQLAPVPPFVMPRPNSVT